MLFIEDRIGRFLKDTYNLIKTCRTEMKNIYIRYGSISGNIPVASITDGWKKYKPGTPWCDSAQDIYALFKTEIVIPENFEGNKVVLQVKTNRTGWNALNPQMLVYIDGREYQGLDTNHTEIVVTECAKASSVYQVVLYAFSGMTLNNNCTASDKSEVSLLLELASVDRRIEKLYYDMAAPWQLLYQLPKDSIDRISLMQVLNMAVNLIDIRVPYSKEFYASVLEADAYLSRQLYSENHGINAEITCIGHTHIDLAWLWRFGHTREKAARSFSTALQLMDLYPEYKFLSSQPQLYEYIKEDHPDVLKRIKERVSEGKWEPEGGMWVEADTNIPSGESLVRQFIYGKRYFMKEFGIDSKILWLPDVFGYSGNLPQIMKKCGVEYFMTAKLVFNEINPFPFHTFLWKGIDGTEVLSHLVILGSKGYNGEGNAEDFMQLWSKYNQKDVNNDILLPCGYGDGGGGTTAEMLEMIRRFGTGLHGAPKVKIESVRKFFERLDAKVRKNMLLPRWNGELYFELHRGTYTSMARVKKMNRKAEFLYMTAEWAASVVSLLFDVPYPREGLEEGWKKLLLCQFHDILPGSSIREVYEDTDILYDEVFTIGNRIADERYAQIASAVKTVTPAILVFNPLSWERRGVIEFECPDCSGLLQLEDNGNVFPCQSIPDKKNRYVCVVDKVASRGYSSYNISYTPDRQLASESSVKISPSLLENPFFIIKLGKDGFFTGIFDKRICREVLKPGERGNVLQVFEDKPRHEDNWNLDIFYSEKMWMADDVDEMEVLENGPVRGILRIIRKFLSSSIRQDIIIYKDIPRIDFRTVIDWKEKDLVLKTAFPVDINANRADYEIQYGYIERSTHRNTSWDVAKFEVCGHKWADLSEDDYGVSILNDCKYGYDIHEGVMRLTLLRCGTKPNPDADKEVHEFTYSLFPHSGGWRTGKTLHEAYGLNCSLAAVYLGKQDGSLPGQLSFASPDKENVILETVKMAEDSNRFILRFYEAYNRRTDVNVTLLRNIEEVRECDLMENDLDANSNIHACDGNILSFHIKPFEIKTFKVSFK